MPTCVMIPAFFASRIIATVSANVWPSGFSQNTGTLYFTASRNATQCEWSGTTTVTASNLPAKSASITR